MKNLYTIAMLFLISACCIATQAQKSDEAVPVKGAPSVSQTPSVLPAAKPEASLLFDNGTFVTAQGSGPSGADGSVLVSPMTSYGSNNGNTYGYRVADDFTVPAGTSWKIDSILVFGYQTGSTTTSTFTGVNYRIWNGFPESANGSLAFGDTTTNKMVSTRWSGCYRYASTSVGTTRPIMVEVLSGNVTLAPGKYWLDWQSIGSLSSGPWVPPVTITGQQITGDAYVGEYHVWQAITDGGTATALGMPFKIYGSTTTVPVELSSFTSSVKDNVVTLKWSTATETNNSGFQIERKSSKDNVWAVAGFVKGNSTSSAINNYSFSDNISKFGVAVFNYRLKQIDFDGTSKYYDLSNSVEVSAPVNFALDQNYPNPFNPTTTIRYSVAMDSKVRIDVYDVLGRLVKNLVNENKAAGNYSVDFNASNLSSGVYMYKISAGNFTAVRKMNLMK